MVPSVGPFPLAEISHPIPHPHRGTAAHAVTTQRSALPTIHCFVLTDQSREDGHSYVSPSGQGEPQLLKGQDPALVVLVPLGITGSFCTTVQYVLNKIHFLQGFFKAVSFPDLKS